MQKILYSKVVQKVEAVESEVKEFQCIKKRSFEWQKKSSLRWEKGIYTGWWWKMLTDWIKRKKEYTYGFRSRAFGAGAPSSGSPAGSSDWPGRAASCRSGTPAHVAPQSRSQGRSCSWLGCSLGACPNRCAPQRWPWWRCQWPVAVWRSLPHQTVCILNRNAS